MAAGEEKNKAAERLERLDHEAGELGQLMALKLHAAVQQCLAEGAEAAAREESAEARRQQAGERQEHCAREAAAAAEEVVRLAGQGGAALLPLQQQLAGVEEEVAVLQRRLEGRRQLAQRRDELSSGLQQAGATQARLAAELAEAQHAQRKGEADLKLAQSAGSTQRLREALAAEMAQLESAIAARDQEAAAAGASVEQAASQVRAAEEERERMLAAAGCQPGPEASREQIAGSSVALAALRARWQQAQQGSQRLRGEAGVLAGRLGAALPAAGCRLLHSCFRFRDPELCQPFAEALEILAGRKLGTVVADTTAAAAQLLGSTAGRGLRVWPLDRLQAADRLQQQRAAAQRCPPGEVVVPVDLVEFEGAATPAILRALGTHVIAASDAVAAQLVAQYGLPSITLEGKITSQGVLQGGWRGSNQQAGQGPMATKLRLDALWQRAQAAEQEAAEAGQAVEAAERELAGQEAQQEAAEQEAADVAAATEELRQCCLELQVVQAVQAEAQASVQRLRADLAAKQGLVRSLGADGGGSTCGSDSEQTATALAGEVKRLRQAAKLLGRQVAEATAQWRQVEDELVDAEDALSGQQGEPWAEQLVEKRLVLESARAALLARQAEAAVHSAEVQARKQALEQLRRRLPPLAEAVAAAEAERAAAGEVGRRLAGTREELEGKLDALLTEAPELRQALAAPGQQAVVAAAEPTPAAAAKEHAQLARQRSKLMQERAAACASRMPLAEQMALRERQGGLAAMKQQAATLELAACRLQDGIQGANPQVLQANQRIFGCIKQTFEGLVATVLPTYEVQISKTGEEVHEGLQFQFRQRGSGAGSGSVGAEGGTRGRDGDGERAAGEEGGGEWHTGLSILSGGQRTMVSLTLVVAVRTRGLHLSGGWNGGGYA